jgi:hypothetical protein
VGHRSKKSVFGFKRRQRGLPNQNISNKKYESRQSLTKKQKAPTHITMNQRFCF